MRLYLILIATLCFLIAVVSAVVWSGLYNVAANVPHWQITRVPDLKPEGYRAMEKRLGCRKEKTPTTEKIFLYSDKTSVV